jgi:hypothetical protein
MLDLPQPANDTALSSAALSAEFPNGCTMASANIFDINVDVRAWCYKPAPARDASRACTQAMQAACVGLHRLWQSCSVELADWS